MSCIDVPVVFPTSFWTVEPVEVTLAILFGLLVGIGIAVLVARCFFQELAKDRIQKSEQTDWTNSGMYEKRISYVPSDEVPLTEMHHENEMPSTNAKNRRRSSVSAKDFHSQVTIDSYDVERPEEVDIHCSLIFALTKGSVTKTQTELSLQDYRETQRLEEQLHQEKSSVFLHLLRIILGKFVAKERLEVEYVEGFLEKYNEIISEATQTIASEQVAAEEEVRQKPDVSKDPLTVEQALEDTKAEGTRKKVKLVQDVQLKIRDDLAQETDLNDEEVDALFEKLSENMLQAERMMGEEAARQAAILQERVERRRAVAQQYTEIRNREESGNQTRESDIQNVLEGLTEDQQLLQEQSDSIMKQFEADLAQIQENHQADVMSQSLQLSEKLRRFREKRLRKLERQQEEEMTELKKASATAVNMADFVEAHHNLLEQHRNKRNELLEELDHREAEDILTLRQQLEEHREESIGKQEESLFEILAERARLSEKEAEKLVKRHAAHVKASQDKQEELKQQQKAEIQERLAQRKALWEEQQQRQEAEQQQLAAQQAKTVSLLLDTQSGLDEEARKQIMLQHEQNSAAVNNQLQMARMKQEKLLQARLAQRQAKIRLLKEKQEEELEAAKSDRHAAQLKEQHAQEMAAETSAIEKAKADLRSRLAQETKEALRSQDEQLGVLIGKLQVGQARRQNIIMKQDKTIKELQDQLVDSVSMNNAVSEHQTDRIIKRHMREIEEVQEKLREAKEHQARVLQDKYEAKKLLKEKTFVSQLEEDRKQMRRNSSTAALGVMSQLLAETRHKQAVSKMEQEMKRELAEQKEDLNQQLERAMVEELQEQEKNFLSQLAAAGQLSRDDLKDMVNTAVAEGGGTASDVRKLNKDLTQRIKSAKAEADYEGEEEEEEEAPRRPLKKKKKGKKK